MKSFLKFGLFVAAAASFTNANAQSNPLMEAKGFNVFTEQNVTAVAGDSHGPIAVGGNLALEGNTVFTMNSIGTYPDSVNTTNNYGMVVNGKIIYTSGNSPVYVNQGYLRIGNATGTTLYDMENTGQTNLQATAGAINTYPRLQLQRYQNKTTATQAHGINFTTAFNQFRFNSDLIASYPGNTACSTYFNFITIPSGNNPHITLQTGKVNYINLTSAQLTALNNQGSIIFDQKPTATRLLVINVTVTGGTSFTWSPFNVGGIDEQDSKFILINFANATAIELGSGNNSSYGTIYAPRADINKTGGNNTNGQIIAKSLRLAYGEIHYYKFNGSFPDCGGTTIINNYNNTRTTQPLPIKEINLTATANATGNSLNWKVVQEQDVVSYAVEKSNDARNFATLQTVIAKGNASVQNYAAEDYEAATATEVYYRVKVNFTNGTATYSNLVKLSKNADAAGTAIYPNPFHNSVNVRVANAGSIVVRIADVSGRVIGVQNFMVNAGETVTVPVDEHLANGMYFVQVYGADKMLITTKTMMKN